MLFGIRRRHPRNDGSATKPPGSILHDNSSVEVQALLSACRVFLGTEEAEQLGSRLRQGPDLERLMALALKNGVLPLLYRSISQNYPHAVPQEWLSRLRMQYMQNAARNLVMTVELLRLLEIFEAHRIRAVPFKGPALAVQAYGDMALRMFVDLDVLVQNDDVLRARDILIAEGYVPELQLNKEQEKAYLRSQCEYNFNHPKRRICVEVHWEIIPPYFAIKFETAGILARAGSVGLMEKTVPAVSPEDLLALLCVHAAKHCWSEHTLKLVCDVAGIINSNDLDWDRAMADAHAARIKRLLLMGAMLAGDLLKANIPAEIADEAGRDVSVISLVHRTSTRLQDEAPGSSMLAEGVAFWLLARENFRDRFRCIMGLAFEPMGFDLNRMPLPARFYPLYHILHPLAMIYYMGLKCGSMRTRK